MIKDNITYSSFFRNIPLELIPLKGSEERKTLIKRELERCKGGVYVDDVYISGWLYWHMNFWWIDDDEIDEYGNINPVESLVSLRDNEWLRSDALEKCRTFQDEDGNLSMKGYIEIGLRQGGKTTTEASITAYNATLYKRSQNIVVSGTDDDLTNIKLRLNYGLGKLWSGIRKPRINKDIKAKQISLGYKTDKGDDVIWSYIITRNIAEGKRTEGPAGVSAKSAIFDEIGKAPFSQALSALKPALVSKFGWRAIPMLVGTGGSFDKGDDAERIFYHPEANNFLPFTDPITGERTGFFLSGLFRTDCKEEMNLAQYLITLGQLPDGNYPELSKIPILVSNKEKAERKIKQERIDKAKDPDQTEYLKLIMYYPLTPQECFLSSAKNFYNQDIARQRREKLEQLGYTPMYCELNEEGGKVLSRVSNKLPITSYPTKEKSDLDTPICILEHPIPSPPFALYVAGIDTYKFPGDPGYSDSLGSIYIFKRVYDVMTDSFQNMFVAWYVGRPSDKNIWNNNARLLLKYYNAQGLVENDEYSFIDYMETSGDGQYLMDTPDFMREYIPNSTTFGRAKGVSREDKRIRGLLRINLKQYMEQSFGTVPIPDSEDTRKLLGIEKINDPVLLLEIEKWNEDRNCDREVSASLAITAAKYYDKQQLNVDTRGDDPRFQSKKASTGKIRVRYHSVFRDMNRSTLRRGAYNKIFKPL